MMAYALAHDGVGAQQPAAEGAAGGAACQPLPLQPAFGANSSGNGITSPETMVLVAAVRWGPTAARYCKQACKAAGGCGPGALEFLGRMAMPAAAPLGA